MWNQIFDFVLVQMVYITAVVFIGGLIFKGIMVFNSSRFNGSLAVYPKGKNRVADVAADAFLVPSALRKDPGFWFVIVAFHVAVLFLVIGHLELIREFSIFQVIPHHVFIGAGWVGIVSILSVLYFLFRRFKSPWREISIPEDYIILLLLFLTIMLGSHMHLTARYGLAGFTIRLEDYRTYMSSLVALDPVIPIGISGSPHYVLIALHIFLANIVLMMLPFTKLVHMIFAFLSLNLKRK